MSIQTTRSGLMTPPRGGAVCVRAHGKYKGGQRRQQRRVDHRQQDGQVTLPGAHKEQSTARPQAHSKAATVHASWIPGQRHRLLVYLDEVKREPLTEPKQDRPTNTGMIHAMGPRCLFPKSCVGTEQVNNAARRATRAAVLGPEPLRQHSPRPRPPRRSPPRD